MVNKRNIEMLKRTAVIIMMFSIIALVCACSVKSKRDLIKYAEINYGKCTFVREEHKGSGNDMVRTVYLKDKETGIEYTVTSHMSSIDIDGSNFGYHEDTTSDFVKLYTEYLFENAENDIKDLEQQFSMRFEDQHSFLVLTFSDRASGRNAEACAKEFDKTLAKYDTKGLRPTEYLMYVEGNIYIGSYDAETKHFSGSNDYSIIDYVHENYDPDAVYLDSMGAYINQFLPYDEVDKLFPDSDGAPMGTAYYFKDKNGEIFVAIDLAEFGASAGGVRLYRDKASGMEEIKF